MPKSGIKPIASWALAVPLGLLYVAAGLGKFSEQAVENFANWGYPSWFASLIGVLEITGGIGLLIPRTTRWAIGGLTVIMLGAAYTHLANGEGWNVLLPVGFMAGLWILCWLRCSSE